MIEKPCWLDSNALSRVPLVGRNYPGMKKSFSFVALNLLY
jgi:hypothetical protein